MSASKHLNKQLFHGTHADLSVGDTIEPRTKWHPDDKGRAFATHDYPSALWYAGNRAYHEGKLFGTVYSVEPKEGSNTAVGEVGRDSVTSDKGFRVKNIAGYIPSDERPNV